MPTHTCTYTMPTRTHIVCSKNWTVIAYRVAGILDSRFCWLTCWCSCKAAWLTLAYHSSKAESSKKDKVVSCEIWPIEMTSHIRYISNVVEASHHKIKEDIRPSCPHTDCLMCTKPCTGPPLSHCYYIQGPHTPCPIGTTYRGHTTPPPRPVPLLLHTGATPPPLSHCYYIQGPCPIGTTYRGHTPFPIATTYRDHTPFPIATTYRGPVPLVLHTGATPPSPLLLHTGTTHPSPLLLLTTHV